MLGVIYLYFLIYNLNRHFQVDVPTAELEKGMSYQLPYFLMAACWNVTELSSLIEDNTVWEQITSGILHQESNQLYE